MEMITSASTHVSNFVSITNSTLVHLLVTGGKTQYRV